MAGAREESHEFEFDGGTVARDFVNTVRGMRGGNDQRDRILTYPDLVYWAGQIGLIDSRQASDLYERAEREPGRAANAHAEAIRRREALHDVVLAAVDERPPPTAALETVNRWVAEAMGKRRLRMTAPGKFEASLEGDGDLLAF